MKKIAIPAGIVAVIAASVAAAMFLRRGY